MNSRPNREYSSQGLTGFQGVFGQTGVQGYAGFTGFCGVTGTQGYAGLTGTQGETGAFSLEPLPPPHPVGLAYALRFQYGDEETSNETTPLRDKTSWDGIFYEEKTSFNNTLVRRKNRYEILKDSTNESNRQS